MSQPDRFADEVRGAVAFVNDVDLPPAPRRTRSAGIGASQPVFDTVKNQALIVGSDIVSFVTGVTPELRRDIVNSSLLAQLAASKLVPDRESIRAWYEAYFDTLGRIGWAIQERGFSEHREAGDDFEAHQAILSVAATLLGPAVTALAVIESTLKAMRSMADGPWMTLFKRESQTAKAARFQVTLAGPQSDAGAMVSLMAFELNAQATLTQVLFFKLHSSDVTLRHASGRVTVSTDILTAVRSTIADKIAAYTKAYIESLPI